MTAGCVEGETQKQDITGYNKKRWFHCPSPLSPYLGTPMDKAIEGEGKGWKQVKPTVFAFTLAFQNIPWAKTNIIIAYPNIIIAYPDIIIANENMIIANPIAKY